METAKPTKPTKPGAGRHAPPPTADRGTASRQGARRPGRSRGAGGPRHWVLSAGKLSLGTIASRLLGVVRDMLRAYYFGTGLAADAFTIAFRLPNMLRALFAEGALSAAFVPVLTEAMEIAGEEEWRRFVRNVAGLLTLTLLLVSLAGILAAPYLIPIIVPGYADVPGKIELTVNLTRWMFPYILLIGLATLAMGTLHALRHFTAPALSAVVMNLGMIGGMVLVGPRLGDTPEKAVYGLAWGVLAGGVLQLLIQLPPLLRHRVWGVLRIRLRDSRVRKMGKLMIPGVVGMGVAEVNAFVDTFLASLLVAGSVAALEYGHRVMQLPLGVFAVALGTAVLPTISRHAARGEDRELGEQFSLAIRLTLFLLLPITGYFLVVHRTLLALLFERGAFAGGNSLDLVSSAFVFYCLGLCSYGLVKVLVPVFYARQNTRTPVRTAATAMAANVVLNLVLMQFLALGGLALATALSSTLNVALLARALKRQYGVGMTSEVGRSAARSAGGAVVAAGVAVGAMAAFGSLWPEGGDGALWPSIALLVATAAAAAGAYLLTVRLLGSRELAFFQDLLRGRVSSS